MKRVKEKWDIKYLEHQATSRQTLRDNTERSKKEPVITNLMLVDQRVAIQPTKKEKEKADEEGNLRANLGSNENKSTT